MSLLFYDDSPVFGGHEVMSLIGLDAVLTTYSDEVHFLFSGANDKLAAKLDEMAARHSHLKTESLPYQSSKFEALRNRLKPSRAERLASRFREIAPALVVAIQGNIEHSSLALTAARLTGLRSTSYIPVPHSNAEMGARLGALRDLFCGHLFKIPDSFITITDEMAKMLKLRGATSPVHIVYNGVDTARFTAGDVSSARQALGLPQDKLCLGVIGRIEFRQKQQHLLLEAIASTPSLASTSHLVFAGEGPDAEELAALLNRAGISHTMLSWCDPARLYQALDALVIPSRYEGLPLVMLEALASGTAVLGSDRDGMRDLLPPEWRFKPNDASALGDCLLRFAAEGRPKPEPALVRRVRESMSLPVFQDSFASSIIGLARNA